MLKAKQVRCVCAQTGREAVKIFKARIKLVAKEKAPMFRIIVMELSMLEKDGQTALKKMKQLF